MRHRALACLLATSCSYAFVRPPPSEHPTASDDCTESRAAPVIDAALTGLMALTLLLGVSRCSQTSGVNQDGSPAEGCDVGPWVGLGLTTVFGVATGISAVHGFRATKSCRNRREVERVGKT